MKPLNHHFDYYASQKHENLFESYVKTSHEIKKKNKGLIAFFFLRLFISLITFLLIH